MGLDTTHEAWHGSYSAFSRWRDRLAEAAGYTFSPRVSDPLPPHGLVSTRGYMPDLDWGCIESVIGTDLLGRWQQIPVRPDGTPDPLIILLAHSDCEGELHHEFLTPLADRLEELLPLLGDEDGGGHVGSYRTKTETFIRGLRAAAEAGDDVGFH